MSKKVTYKDKPWIKHYEKGVPASIKYKDIFLPQILDDISSRFPDVMALCFEGYKISFKQLKEMVDCLATCLADFGIHNGSILALSLFRKQEEDKQKDQKTVLFSCNKHNNTSLQRREDTRRYSEFDLLQQLSEEKNGSDRDK